MSKKQWYVISVLHRFYNEEDKRVLSEFLSNGWAPIGATEHVTPQNHIGFYYHLRKKA